MVSGISYVISSFGLAIGLAWERAFQRGGEDIFIRLGQYGGGEIPSLFDNNDEYPPEKDVVHECNAGCKKVYFTLYILSTPLMLLALVPVLRHHIINKVQESGSKALKSHQSTAPKSP